MTFAQYIILIESLKALFSNRVIGVIPSLETFALSAVYDWIEQNLDTKKGAIIIEAATIEAINDFDAYMMKELTDFQKYKEAVSDSLKGLPKIAETIEKFQTSQHGIDWNKLNIKPQQELVINEALNAYTGSGLNSNFVQPLRDKIYVNVVSGANLTEIKEQLKEEIISGKVDSKLSKYLTNTSMQAVDAYSGIINKKLMETFNYDFVQMSGSLIKTSSPQCVKGINEFDGLISRETYAKILEPIAEKNGLILGTTFDTLDFFKFHWGCRHEFTPTMTKTKTI